MNSTFETPDIYPQLLTELRRINETLSQLVSPQSSDLGFCSLIIAPKTGEENVVFCQVYYPDNLMRWENGDDWNRLESLQQLAHRLDCDLFPNVERDSLMAQSNSLMQQLQWSVEDGKQFLDQQFQLTSRQLLSDQQLAQFVLSLWQLAIA